MQDMNVKPNDAHMAFCICMLKAVNVAKDEEGWNRMQSLGTTFQNIDWERAQKDARMACVYIMFPHILPTIETIEKFSEFAFFVEILVCGSQIPQIPEKFQTPRQELLLLFDRKRCGPKIIEMLIDYGWLKE